MGAPVVYHQPDTRVTINPPGSDKGVDQLRRGGVPAQSGCDSLVWIPTDIALRSVLSGEMKEQFEQSYRIRPANTERLREREGLRVGRSAALHRLQALHVV